MTPRQTCRQAHTPAASRYRLPGGTPTQQTIPVTLLVSTSPLLNVATGSLNFTYQVGAGSPASQNVTVTSTSGQLTLAISESTSSGGSWLSVPSTGTTGTAFPVSISPTGLTPGTYNGTVTVSASGAANGPLTIPVTLVVANNPVVVVSVNGCSTAVNQNCSMVFAGRIGRAPAPSQNLSITSSTGATLTYTATVAFGPTNNCSGVWLLPGDTVSQTASGTTSALLPVFVQPGSLAAGTTCNGTIVITAANAATGAAVPNSPISIPVTMFVSSNAQLVSNVYALNFSAPVSGASPAAQTINLTSTSATDQVAWVQGYTTTSGGNNWLFASPLQGTTAPGQNTITVQVLPGLLSPGTYNGSITISSAGIADSPISVLVTFQVTAGTMSVSPSTLSFTQTAGGTAPAAQTLSVTSGGQALAYSVTSAVSSTSGSVNWLTVTPASGTTPGTVTVTANGSTLPAGIYNGTVTITSTTPSTGGSPATIPVTLTVTAGTISATPTSLTFSQVAGTQTTQQLTVNGSPGAINFTLSTSTTTGGNWLTVTPGSGTTGTSTGAITVTANSANLAVGQYTGSVTITAAAPGATGSPITVPVTLNVVNAQTLTAAPTTLNFAFVTGGSNPAPQTVQVTVSGSTQVPFTAAATTTPAGGTWLTVSPTSGTTPGTVTVSVNAQTLAASATPYTGTITISSPNSATPVTVPVSLTVSNIPTPIVNAIGNAASYATGGVSPGENIVIFGTGIGPAQLAGGTLTSGGAFATTAGNTQVTFDGTPAPVIYASATQTSVMVPYGVFGRTVTTIRLSYQGVLSAPLIYNVTQAAPGIYTLNQSGTGPGAILNQDYSVNGPGKPAAKGSVVAVYMTGEGETNTVPADGSIAPVNGTGLYKPLLAVTATVGGIPATVQYFGSSPGIVYGVMQVNLTIPPTVPSGPQPIVITVGANNTQTGVTVTVQ